MANILPILFIAILYGIWKLLDSMALPNTLSIMLVGLVVISSSFWAYYKFSANPRRQRKIQRLEQRTGTPLTNEEKAKIDPPSIIGEFFASLAGVLLIVTLLRSFLFEPFQIPSGSMEPTLRVGDFLIVEKYAYGIKDPIFQNTLIETGHPQRGDVVVFKAPKHPHIDYIKRVIGIGGDRIFFDINSRHLSIIHGKDGQPCQENCEVTQFKYQGAEPNPNFFYHGEMQVESTEISNVTHQILNNPNAFNYAPYFFTQNGIPAGEWLVPKDHYFVMGDNRDNSEDSRFWGFVPEQALVGKASYIWLSLDKKPNAFPEGIRFERIFTKIK